MLNYKNLFTRILSGIVYIAVLMLGILINQQFFACIFSLLLLVSLNEFYNIIDKLQKKRKLTIRIIDLLGGLSLFISSFLYYSGIINPGLLFVSFVTYILIRFIYELYQKDQNTVQSLGYSFLGQIYLSIPFTLINSLIFVSHDFQNTKYHSTFILALLIFIWVNDSFAYLVGSMLGKHKMFERISPKKSWEGFFGGAVFTIVASIIYSYFYTSLNTTEWVIFALITVVFSTFGDLIESQFKRTLNIKDSGNIIPGHGGILDRLDSLIFSLPALFVYLSILFN